MPSIEQIDSSSSLADWHGEVHRTLPVHRPYALTIHASVKGHGLPNMLCENSKRQNHLPAQRSGRAHQRRTEGRLPDGSPCFDVTPASSDSVGKGY